MQQYWNIIFIIIHVYVHALPGLITGHATCTYPCSLQASYTVESEVRVDWEPVSCVCQKVSLLQSFEGEKFCNSVADKNFEDL